MAAPATVFATHINYVPRSNMPTCVFSHRIQYLLPNFRDDRRHWSIPLFAAHIDQMQHTKLSQYSGACYFLASFFPHLVNGLSPSPSLWFIHKTFRRSNLIKQVLVLVIFVLRWFIVPRTYRTRLEANFVSQIKLQTRKTMCFVHGPSVYVGCGICVSRVCFWWHILFSVHTRPAASHWGYAVLGMRSCKQETKKKNCMQTEDGVKRLNSDARQILQNSMPGVQWENEKLCIFNFAHSEQTWWWTPFRTTFATNEMDCFA